MPCFTAAGPDKQCSLCPRLTEFRWKNRVEHPSFYNAPVPAFGAIKAELLVVGLAPGLKGANQTGRPFTGDYAGDVLYPGLQRAGFARGHYAKHAGDGFTLSNCRVTNAVRCVPPENKPIGDEIAQCRGYLQAELQAMKQLKVIISLGGIAHKSVLAACGYRQSAYAFGHGAEHILSTPWHNRILLINSYHCSRYNINTNRLTQAMFNAIAQRAKEVLDTASARMPSQIIEMA